MPEKAVIEAVQKLIPQLDSERNPTAASIRQLRNSPHDYLVIAQVAGVSVGMLTLNVTHRIGGAVGRIEDVVVDSAYRNQGVAKALIKAAHTQATALGLYKTALQSQGDRKAAHHVYHGFGYKSYSTYGFSRRNPEVSSQEQDLPELK